MDKQDIERQVDALLESYGYRPERDTYVDILNFTKKFGFTVGNAALPDNEDGFILIKPRTNKNADGDSARLIAHSTKLIGVNIKRNLEWKRFVIAHEFAHSILHYKSGEIYLHRENAKGRNEEENDADYFAAALLMPRASFKRVYNELEKKQLNKNTICYQMAAIYMVPFESVARRIDEVCI